MSNNNLYERWIEALESGKYPKTRRVLRNDLGYCCLGVVCDVVDPNMWQRTDGQANYHIREGDKIHSVDLPHHIQQELKLYSPTSMFLPSDLSPELLQELETIAGNPHSLVGVNDLTSDFDLVVKILKERPPSLFKKELK